MMLSNGISEQLFTWTNFIPSIIGILMYLFFTNSLKYNRNELMEKKYDVDMRELRDQEALLLKLCSRRQKKIDMYESQ